MMAISIITAEAAKHTLLPLLFFLLLINMAYFTKQSLQSLLRFHSVNRYRKRIQTTAKLEVVKKKFGKVESHTCFVGKI